MAPKKRITVAPQYRNCSSDVTSLMMHVVRCNRTAEKTLGCNLYKTYDDRFIHRCMLFNFDIDVHNIRRERILISHFKDPSWSTDYMEYFMMSSSHISRTSAAAFCL